MTTPKNKLEQQIKEARQKISADGYPMSIGEFCSLYKQGELIIRPEYQRFFRWSNLQKSRLIESILLGIPLPSIFLSQTEDGKWELIDGLQRISTILQFMGELQNHHGIKNTPLALQGTKYLPALEGLTWSGPDPKKSLTDAQKIDIKRSKLDLKIIKRDSSPQAKYDLFQRLNSYGEALTPQEMRSALIVSISPDCFAWIENLSRNPDFIKCTRLSERLLEERYDLEIVIRFLVLHNRDESQLKTSSLRDFSKVLDEEIIKFATSFPKKSIKLQKDFEKTFFIISNNGADLVFKRWDKTTKEFNGSFLNSSFEIFGLGLGYYIANKLPFKKDLLHAVQSLWSKAEMSAGYATGRSTEARLAEFVPLGRKLLSGA